MKIDDLKRFQDNETRIIKHIMSVQNEKDLSKKCLFIFSFAGCPPVVKRESGFIHERVLVGRHFSCSDIYVAGGWSLGPVRICRLLLEHIPGWPNYDQEWSIVHMWSSGL